MRPLSAFAIAVVSLLAAVAFDPAQSGHTQADATLRITSNIAYNVKTEPGPVKIVWDVTIVNNDPTTRDNGNGTVSYYDTVRLPVIRGATNAIATDGDGESLTVAIEDAGPGIAQRATLDFTRPLFFQETYNIRLTYELPDTRGQSILITPNYAFLPIIAAGDEATVTVNTPSGDPWQVSLEAEQCTQNGNAFTCAGADGSYLVATVEVSQPAATATLTFEVPLEDQAIAVSLTYLQGEDAAANHQRDLVSAGLPLIEQAMGFNYGGASELSIAQSGRQSVLGYEGLTSCSDASCEVVLSPIADDFTVLHELSHLWSTIFTKRWLSEGFAQLIPVEIAPLMPQGLVQGSTPQRGTSSVALQLDDWGDVESVIGAEDEELALIDAGYDYSLRFLQELQTRFGTDTLRAVNRNIAGSGESADSRRFMDILEEATGANLDDLFLVWVFPGSYRETLATRREAKTRLGELRTRLANADLPDDALVTIQADIRNWDFESALNSIDSLDANIDTYAELTAQLRNLETGVQLAGLVLAPKINDALLRFDFDGARGLIASASAALSSYVAAREDVEAPRSLWEKFGTLGSNPDQELRSAEDAFANGDFVISSEHSDSASDLIANASTIAFRRLLIVAGFLGVLALLIGVAFAITQLRQRALADR